MKRDSKRRAAHPLAQRARSEGAPLIDDAGGERVEVTFLCAGQTQPGLSGDFTDWAGLNGSGAPLAMQRVARGLWARTLDLPREAYVEYAFVVGGRRRLDRRNPLRSDNGLGGHNSALYLPGAQPEPRRHRGRGVAHGAVTRHVIDDSDAIVGGRRAVHVYQPPGVGPGEAVPMLVVLDGNEYLRRASVCEIADNLIHEGRIRPIAMALVEHHPEERFIEYACSDAHALFLSHDVPALVRRQVTVLETPGAHGLLGASLGGVMALYTALRAPRVFGRVLAQSGAFSVDVDGAIETDLVVFDLVERLPARPLRVYLDVGAMEGLVAVNRRMRDALAAKGHDVTYREYAGGHNYPRWRDDLANGLVALFGS